MSPSLFRVCVEVAGIALAVWLDLRFETRRPASILRRVGHAAAALLAVEATGGVVVHLGVDAAPAERLMLMLAVFLPALVYACLAALWLVRSLADAMRMYA
jgi:hypothetical protein